MADCLISFGSNLGDGSQAFAEIRDAFRSHPGVEKLRASGLHSTRSIGGADPQPNYLNAAIRCSTVLEPTELLQWLLAIEQRFGRVRTKRWGPRTVDLDLLLYDHRCHRLPIDGGQLLIVPHPRMSYRRFVLTPAAEIAADMRHPLAHMTVGELLMHLDSTANGIAVVGDSRRVQAMLDAIVVQQPNASRNRSVLRVAGMEISYEVRTTIAPLEFPFSENRFAVVRVDCAEGWTHLRGNVKLLVFWRRDFESPENHFVGRVLREFAGPRLELEGENDRDSASEIVAAMAAMLPNSIE